MYKDIVKELFIASLLSFVFTIAVMLILSLVVTVRYDIFWLIYGYVILAVPLFAALFVIIAYRWWNISNGKISSILSKVVSIAIIVLSMFIVFAMISMVIQFTLMT